MLRRAGAAPALLWRGRCGLCVPVWRLHTRPGDPGRRGPILGGILRLRRMRGWPLGHVFGALGVEGTGTPWGRGRCGGEDGRGSREVRRDGRDAAVGCRGIRDRSGRRERPVFTAGTGWWMPLALFDRVCGYWRQSVWWDVEGGSGGAWWDGMRVCHAASVCCS